MVCAKKLGMNPKELAEKITQELSARKVLAEIEKIELAGPGSDSDHPKHYVKEGEVVAFELDFTNYDDPVEGVEDITSLTKELKLIHDEVKCRIECLICSHTESYKGDSRSSYNAARARMSRHLKSSSEESSIHRELYVVEFGA